MNPLNRLEKRWERNSVRLYIWVGVAVISTMQRKIVTVIEFVAILDMATISVLTLNWWNSSELKIFKRRNVFPFESHKWIAQTTIKCRLFIVWKLLNTHPHSHTLTASHAVTAIENWRESAKNLYFIAFMFSYPISVHCVACSTILRFSRREPLFIWLFR